MKPKPKLAADLMKEIEPECRAILERVGLDIDDPELEEMLSGVDPETFNRRLNALIAKKGIGAPKPS